MKYIYDLYEDVKTEAHRKFKMRFIIMKIKMRQREMFLKRGPDVRARLAYIIKQNINI